MGLVLFTFSLVRKKCTEAAVARDHRNMSVPEPYDRTKPDPRVIRHKRLQIIVPDLNEFFGQLGLQSLGHSLVLRQIGQIGELLRIAGCVEQLDPAGGILLVLNVGPLVLAEQKALSRRCYAESSVANREASGRRAVLEISLPCRCPGDIQPTQTGNRRIQIEQLNQTVTNRGLLAWDTDDQRYPGRLVSQAIPWPRSRARQDGNRGRW